MRVTVVGTGYVGLVTGTCLAALGHTVCCVDNNQEKVSALQHGRTPIFEPGLEALIRENTASGRLTFSGSLAKNDADVVFIAVGTPTNPENGQADLRYVFAAAKEIAQNLTCPAVVVVKSTVPVGTGQKIAQILAETNPTIPCEVVSNPEFLREGSAIQDFMQPDRIVVGSASPHAREVMEALYQPFLANGKPVLFMDALESAELAKYASNAYLAMRISFVNEISDMCEKLDANIEDVTKAMGLDKRIGPYFLKPGPGFGGSCFPKDTLALREAADSAQCPSEMVKAAILSNEARKLRMAHKIIAACNGDVRGKTLAILGLTFKANTDDMRESPSLVVIPELIAQGAYVKVFDPEGMKEAKALLPQDNITWCDSAYDALHDADVCAIITEWEMFKTLDFPKAATLMQQPVIVDLRRILPANILRKAGFRYITIGQKEQALTPAALPVL